MAATATEASTAVVVAVFANSWCLLGGSSDAASPDTAEDNIHCRLSEFRQKSI